jgi:hypothetical protein
MGVWIVKLYDGENGRSYINSVHRTQEGADAKAKSMNDHYQSCDAPLMAKVEPNEVEE